MKRYSPLLFFILICANVFCEEARFYSQIGQDEFVYEHFFKQKKSGFFVDIGAYDGVTGSNSYFFEKSLGWNGICVEPIPELFQKCKEVRKCISINACISDKEGVGQFLRITGPDEMLSGLIDNYNPQHRELVERIAPLYGDRHDLIKVNCLPFMKLLEYHGIKHIDYLSIDTEGGELEILKSIDFDKVTIDVIDVENNYNDPRFSEFLQTKGYKLIKRIIVDEIYKKVEPINSNIEKAFTAVYEQALWGCNEEGVGFSGTGSAVQYAAPYMSFLQNFLKTNNIRSVVDIGCGDWTFSRFINWGDISYTGIDIVKSVIDRNKERFSSPNITFIHGDGTYEDLPAADLLICKDVLQHLSNESVAEFLKHTGKFKHCLITNDIDFGGFGGNNLQIVDGDHRMLDLSQPPFNVRGEKVFTYPSQCVTKQVLHIKHL